MELSTLLLILVVGITLITLLIGHYFFKDKPFEIGIVSIMSIFFTMALFGLIMDSRPDMTPANVADFSFESTEKQQIAEFVAKNDTLCVKLQNGQIYKLSDSWNDDKSNVYVTVNTDTAQNCFIASGEYAMDYVIKPFYVKTDVSQNLLFVDQETYDKIFTVKDVEINQKGEK